MLPRWFELFGRDQFYLAASEDFYADPAAVTAQVWSFLGLPPATLASQRRFNYHPAPDIGAATRQRLTEAFAEHNRELEHLLGRTLPWAGQISKEPAR
jgi:hypothetical protein